MLRTGQGPDCYLSWQCASQLPQFLLFPTCCGIEWWRKTVAIWCPVDALFFAKNQQMVYRKMCFAESCCFERMDDCAKQTGYLGFVLMPFQLRSSHGAKWFVRSCDCVSLVLQGSKQIEVWFPWFPSPVTMTTLTVVNSQSAKQLRCVCKPCSEAPDRWGSGLRTVELLFSTRHLPGKTAW